MNDSKQEPVTKESASPKTDSAPSQTDNYKPLGAVTDQSVSSRHHDPADHHTVSKGEPLIQHVRNLVIDEITKDVKHTTQKGGRNLFTLAKWISMGVITGSIVGCICTLFYHALHLANAFRAAHDWMMFFLPLAGLIIVFLYKITNNTKDRGTNMVIASIHSSTGVSHKMAPLIFISTVLTHLCGGSAGREGAAIQLGGSITDLLTSIKFLRFTENDRRINIMCGMSAGFSALFGTPMAAAIFSLEVISVGIMHYSALVPCILSSYIAFFIAGHFGVIPEAFHILEIPAFAPKHLFLFLVFGMVLGLISILFCSTMHRAEHLYKHYLKNPYIRIAVAGCLIIVLTLILGTNQYLGSGMGIIEHIFEHDTPAAFYVFLLKILFTALTLGAGFKGGEIVPSFCIGAAFGSCVASLMGMPVTLVTACGMVGVFCGVTNCPITSLLIAFELFGFEGMPYFLITIAVSYMLSGYYGLYSAQKIIYSKMQTQFVNLKAH